jgi:hypothetical protein
VVGFVSAGITFLPRLTVEPGGQIDPSSPYPIPFKITNSGAIPLSDVQPMIGLCEIDYGHPPHDLPERCSSHLGSLLVFKPWFTKKLAVDEAITIDLNDLIHVPFGAKFSAADISIDISFYPWFLRFWPFRADIERCFQTKLEPDGKLLWKARPVEK